MAKEQSNDKYTLTEETCVVDGVILYRIKALKDFCFVHAGDLGGFIQSYSNLSQDGDCWVYDEAKVFGDAQVSDNARIEHSAVVYGQARVSGDSLVSDDCRIKGVTIVSGRAMLCGKTEVSECATIAGDACIETNNEIRGTALISSNNDFIHVTSKGCHKDNLLAYKTKGDSIRIHCDIYEGDIFEFINYVYDLYESPYSTTMLQLVNFCINALSHTRRV